MNTKMMTKVLAAFLAFILSFANVLLLGSYMDKTYAAETELENQTTNIKNTAVKFDAYFQEEKAVHTKEINIEGEEKLFLSIKSEDGYLSGASIKINNANFKVHSSNEKLDKIQSISSDENRIELNQINKDESVILEVPIKMNTDSSFNVKDLSKIASITLEGTYVNNKGKEMNIEKTIEIETILDGTANSSLTEEVIKYVTFDVNGNKGVILQTLVKSKLTDNKLPVKTTKLEIEIPTINNIKPKEVALSAKSLMATKAEGAKVFNKEDYKYEDGKITLEIENDSQILSWVKNSEDEIIITCIYEEEAITDKANINLRAKSEITYYGKELKTANSKVNETVELKEKIGDIVTFDVESSKEELYKGYMLEAKGKNTEFTDIISANIGYSDLMDKITFADTIKYVDEYKNLYPANVLYTYSKISEENLKSVLGEDGFINIYSKSKELIATLNKENLECIFEKEESDLTFETSKPISEGILKIENGRSIKPLEYATVQEEMFTELKVELNSNVMVNDTAIIKTNNERIIKLINPQTTAEISIGNENLSTVVTNEGVELRVTLKSKDASNLLYKNPEVSIVFPKEITGINIENVKLLYEKELKLASAKIYRNDAGNIVVNVKLSGEQTSYNENVITEGATLIMKADITADKITPTGLKDVELYVKNEKSKEEAVTKKAIKFIAPAGIATVSEVSGYSDSGEVATSISGNVGIGEIKAAAPARKASIKMLAINNYEYNCDNVAILGRTTFEGNKKITTGENLGSTFTADVVSEIKNTNGLSKDQMTVYYSENKEANKNLTDTANGWTTDINEIEDVNSYMVVLNDYTFETGDVLEFTYDIEIPENVGGDKATYGAFAVYYEKAEKEEASPMAFSLRSSESTIALASETAPNLSVTLSSDLEEGTKIQEGKRISYTANIQNNNQVAGVENVVLEVLLSRNVAFNSENGTYVSRYDGDAEFDTVHIPVRKN